MAQLCVLMKRLNTAITNGLSLTRQCGAPKGPERYPQAMEEAALGSDGDLEAMLDEGLFGGVFGRDVDDNALANNVNEKSVVPEPSQEAGQQRSGGAQQQHPPAAATATDPQPPAKRARQGDAAINDDFDGSCPPHPGWWGDMCIRCGAARVSAHMDPVRAHAAASTAASATRIRHLHHRSALEVCHAFAHALPLLCYGDAAAADSHP